MNAIVLWIAQGFGSGRAAIAPGTFGSLVGLLWFTVLLLPQNIWVFSAGAVGAVALSVPVCGAAEKILQQKDPGSIVLDEIVAVPLCFAGWVSLLILKIGAMPSPEYFFSKGNWHVTLGVFAAFRFFDVLKPWPIRRSQSLHGGLGVVVDDVLAAVYVVALTLVVGMLVG